VCYIYRVHNVKPLPKKTIWQWTNHMWKYIMCRYSSSLPWLISRKIRGVKAIDLLGPTAGKHVLFSLGVWNMTAELELESQSFAWFTLWI
jgi:hypothetical protein